MFWIPTFRTCCRIVPSAGYNEALHSKGEKLQGKEGEQERNAEKGRGEREGRGKNKRVNKQVKLGYIIFN